MAETAPDDQRFQTEGLPALDRPGLSARFLMATVACLERLNIRCAKLGNSWVYDNALFPWSRDLEAAWPAMRLELDRLLVRRGDLPSIRPTAAGRPSF
jgi:aspartyl/asparaginyl beta-hydroxylase (cupin superfamily)